MIRDINISLPRKQQESNKERLLRMRKIKDLLQRRHMPVQEYVDVSKIPF